jgi:hypothetical protein
VSLAFLPAETVRGIRSSGDGGRNMSRKHLPDRNRFAGSRPTNPQRFPRSVSAAVADPFEIEADRTASQLVSGTSTLLGTGMERTRNSNVGASQSIPAWLRTNFQTRLGVSVGDVRLHTGDVAANLADGLDARAVTVGQDIYFGRNEYRPGSLSGDRLIAHEVAHTVQQRSSSSAPTQQRDARHPSATTASKSTAYSSIRMQYDGRQLHVFGGGTEIFAFSANSGNPVRISAEDAAKCGADQVLDTYMDDPRFVGIHDRGPIPEGQYSLSPPSIERWGFGAQMGLLTHNVLGTAPPAVTHLGDWGKGRVPLAKLGPVREGPCGDKGGANTRFGFFLHGGLLAGSAGCIDIDGDFDRLADWLAGDRRTVVVTVKYSEKPPSVGYFTGMGGMLAYQTAAFQHGPHLRLGAEFAPLRTLAFTSVAYDATLAWAGGSLSAGAHLDVSFSDRESFVRTGLTGSTNFRILRGLYGRLFAGPTWLVSGPGSRTTGLEAGGGLEYDFGRVHLEALYDVLVPMSNDPTVHRALVGLGARF